MRSSPLSAEKTALNSRRTGLIVLSYEKHRLGECSMPLQQSFCTALEPPVTCAFRRIRVWSNATRESALCALWAASSDIAGSSTQ